jgi:DNA-binding response OmpR family regulator
VSTPQADVLLVAADWRTRALLRAQLIESGAAVVATDSWPSARQHLLVSGLPRAVVLDLHALDAAASALRELASVVPPDRVLAIAEATTSVPADLAASVRILRRPVSIGEISRAATQMLT